MEPLLKFVIHYQAHIFLNHSLNDASHSAEPIHYNPYLQQKEKRLFAKKSVDEKKKNKTKLGDTRNNCHKIFPYNLETGTGRRGKKKEEICRRSGEQATSWFRLTSNR